MTNTKISVTFNPDTSQHLVEMARVTNLSVEELTERLIREAIKLEEEDIALSKIVNDRDVDGAEIVDYEDVKWRC